MLDIFAFDHSFLSAHKISHVKNGHGLEGVQVHLCFTGEKPVYLPLRLHLRAQLFGGNLHLLRLTSHDLIIVGHLVWSLLILIN